MKTEARQPSFLRRLDPIDTADTADPTPTARRSVESSGPRLTFDPDASMIDRVDMPDRVETVQATRTVDATRTPSSIQRDPSLKPIIDGMLARLDASDLIIDGDTPRSLFEREILNNPKVTDDQIRRMGEVSIDQISDSPSARRRTLRRFPDVQSSINHRFTRDLIAGITGLSPDAISNAKPSLGLTGSARFGPLWKSEVPEVQKFTALHDTTSVLQDAGVRGLNKAVWGQSSSVVSAVLNFPLGAQLRRIFTGR